MTGLNHFSMVSAFLPLCLLGFIVFYTSLAVYVPPDNYLIACGAFQNVSFQGQIYLPDSGSSSFSLKTASSYIATSNSAASVSPIYQSARIFSSLALYQFNINQPGRHWIRLYFYPVPGHNLSSVTLNVVTDDFVLISGFTFENYNGSTMFKEYAVNVTSNFLSLYFVPSKNSISFVNAIAVVSIPDAIFPDEATSLDNLSPFGGLYDHAFETVYRLNMGGPMITPQNDTLGRVWENDAKYLVLKDAVVNGSVNPASIRYPKSVPPEIAPNWVYATANAMGNPNVISPNFNITWAFPVDPKCAYFVRVHFCDIISNAINTLVFSLYIDTKTAFQGLDLSAFTRGLDVPLYRDFVSNITSDSGILTVSIGPSMQADTNNATINGLEILKLSNEAKSLDGLASVAHFLPESSSKFHSFDIIIVAITGCVASCALVGLCYCCLSRRSNATHQEPWLPLPGHGNSQTVIKMSTISLKSGTTSFVSHASSSHGRVFTFQEILDATNKFDENLLLGVGGFGRVYRGTLEDGTKVAVKRGNPRSEQGLSEFRTEIEMLSKLRHRHLVSLIGYCDERSEMILVYEYMANGPLRSHLYGTDLPPLPWKQRLEICIGAARGLHYLHTGATQSIIHRDVKTTNILLDENFVAKVADFGLSKTGPSLDQTHVSTAVKGSFGYLDPEYFRRQQLTDKSDVYSFGVVMMEVLCTRPALNPVLPRDQVNIAEWAMSWQKKGKLASIIDPYLLGKVAPASLKKYGETAEKCLAEHGVDRPSMGDVLWNLEYALQLEETSSALMENEDNSTNHIQGIPLTPVWHFDNSASIVDGVNSPADDDTDDVATSAVFSQLLNPLGR